jgi:hypothetical protein
LEIDELLHRLQGSNHISSSIKVVRPGVDNRMTIEVLRICRTTERVSPNLSAGLKPAERIVIAFSCFALYMAHPDSF